MVSAELQLFTAAASTPRPFPPSIPPVPWRDPHTVSPEQLRTFIGELERAAEANPGSADLRTCLGMAYAMNYQAYKSMDALEAACTLDPENFFAHFKRAELNYRLRALPRAERETLEALGLAQNSWEMALARHQLQEIRRLMREGTQKPEWTKKLLAPALVLAGMFILISVVSLWL
jgi:hypothetical protein